MSSAPDLLSRLKQIESESNKDRRDKLTRKFERQIVQNPGMTESLVSLLEERKHWDTEPLTLFDRVFDLIRKSTHLNAEIAKRALIATSVIVSHERFKGIKRSPESPSVKLITLLRNKYPAEVNEAIEFIRKVQTRAKKRAEAAEKAKALEEHEAARREKEQLEKAKEAAKNGENTTMQMPEMTAVTGHGMEAAAGEEQPEAAAPEEPKMAATTEQPHNNESGDGEEAGVGHMTQMSGEEAGGELAMPTTEQAMPSDEVAAEMPKAMVPEGAAEPAEQNTTAVPAPGSHEEEVHDHEQQGEESTEVPVPGGHETQEQDTEATRGDMPDGHGGTTMVAPHEEEATTELSATAAADDAKNEKEEEGAETKMATEMGNAVEEEQQHTTPEVTTTTMSAMDVQQRANAIRTPFTIHLVEIEWRPTFEDPQSGDSVKLREQIAEDLRHALLAAIGSTFLDFEIVKLCMRKGSVIVEAEALTKEGIPDAQGTALALEQAIASNGGKLGPNVVDTDGLSVAGLAAHASADNTVAANQRQQQTEVEDNPIRFQQLLQVINEDAAITHRFQPLLQVTNEDAAITHQRDLRKQKRSLAASYPCAMKPNHEEKMRDSRLGSSLPCNTELLKKEGGIKVLSGLWQTRMERLIAEERVERQEQFEQMTRQMAEEREQLTRLTNQMMEERKQRLDERKQRLDEREQLMRQMLEERKQLTRQIVDERVKRQFQIADEAKQRLELARRMQESEQQNKAVAEQNKTLERQIAEERKRRVALEGQMRAKEEKHETRIADLERMATPFQFREVLDRAKKKDKVKLNTFNNLSEFYNFLCGFAHGSDAQLQKLPLPKHFVFDDTAQVAPYKSLIDCVCEIMEVTVRFV